MARGVGNVRLPHERRGERRRGLGEVPLDVNFDRMAQALASLYILVYVLVVVFLFVFN